MQKSFLTQINQKKKTQQKGDLKVEQDYSRNTMEMGKNGLPFNFFPKKTDLSIMKPFTVQQYINLNLTFKNVPQELFNYDCC